MCHRSECWENQHLELPRIKSFPNTDPSHIHTYLHTYLRLCSPRKGHLGINL